MIRQTFDTGAHLRTGGAPAPATPLLYLHGLGESALCFERILRHPKLAAFRHLAPDLPGYGKSPWPAVPRRLEEQAQWLGHWLRETVEEPVVVVGHSMGGVVGMMLAEQYPDQVRAFVNVEGNISLEDCGFSGPIAAFERGQFLEQGLRRIFEGVYQDGLKDAALRTYFVSISLCDPRVLHLHSEELVAISRAEELAARLAALPIPLTYVLGSPRGTGGYSRSLLDGAGIRWQAIAGAGHWPFIDQPEAFAEVLLSFLKSLEEPPPASERPLRRANRG